MNRLLMIGSLAGLLFATTGCLHHNTRSGGKTCASGHCGSGTCSSGTCSTGSCGNGACSSGDCYGEGGACMGDGLCGGNCGDSCQAGPYAYGDGGRCVGDGCGNCSMCAKVGGICGACANGGCRPGCIPGRLGWQQGGLDYSAYLRPGMCGHHAGDALNSRPFTAGPPTATVGYPYYTHRGPRDFFLDNPPSIGR